MQDSIPSFKPIVLEWESYCALADMPNSNRLNPNKYTGRRTRQIWERVDTSLPILIGNHTFYVRILDHKIRGLCLDIRRFEHRTDGVREWYEPTEEGLTLPISSWIKLFDPIFKLIKKWKDR